MQEEIDRLKEENMKLELTNGVLESDNLKLIEGIFPEHQLRAVMGILIGKEEAVTIGKIQQLQAEVEAISDELIFVDEKLLEARETNFDRMQDLIDDAYNRTGFKPPKTNK
jgi:hypothetical protein